jgi:hypothetical protein
MARRHPTSSHLEADGAQLCVPADVPAALRASGPRLNTALENMVKVRSALLGYSFALLIGVAFYAAMRLFQQWRWNDFDKPPMWLVFTASALMIVGYLVQDGADPENRTKQDRIMSAAFIVVAVAVCTALEVYVL